MEYFERIKNLRIDNDKSQKEIAEVLGTEQSYYAKYENGKRPLPIERLKKLCEYYNVSADYILGLSENLPYKILHIYRFDDSAIELIEEILYPEKKIDPDEENFYMHQSRPSFEEWKESRNIQIEQTENK